MLLALLYSLFRLLLDILLVRCLWGENASGFGSARGPCGRIEGALTGSARRIVVAQGRRPAKGAPAAKVVVGPPPRGSVDGQVGLLGPQGGNAAPGMEAGKSPFVAGAPPGARRLPKAAMGSSADPVHAPLYASALPMGTTQSRMRFPYHTPTTTDDQLVQGSASQQLMVLERVAGIDLGHVSFKNVGGPELRPRGWPRHAAGPTSAPTRLP